jgi:hypothetical protein
MTQSFEAMITPVVGVPEIARLARHQGDCWTALLPATHPGAPEGDKLTALRGLAQSLGVRVGATWLERMEQLLVDNQRDGGGEGLAIFAGDDFLEAVVADVSQPQIAQGLHCYILPLLREVNSLRDFYILGLSRKQVRLLRYTAGAVEEMRLPGDMPVSLEDFHPALNREDQIDFDTDAEHLAHFFQTVDTHIAKLLGDAPVLLMGVGEEVALFRRRSRQLLLLEPSIQAGIRGLTLGEIAQLGGACAQSTQAIADRAALQRMREWPDRKLVEEDLRRIVTLAANGQVQELLLREPAAHAGLVTEAEELANAAAVETFRHRGMVRLINPADMRGFGAAVALLRY